MASAQSTIVSTLKIPLLAWIICSLGATFYCYEYLLRVLPSVMSAELMQFFSIDAVGYGHLAGFYYYAYTPMQLPVGILMDRYGPKLLLTLACLICAIGAYVFSMTGNIYVSQLGRFLVGFGSAFAFVGVLKLATVWLPPERFALVSGLTTTLGMIGAAFASKFLGDFVDDIGWQEVNFVFVIFGVVLTTLLFIVIRSNSGLEGAQQQKQRVMSVSELMVGFISVLKNPQIWINGFIGLALFTSLSVFAETWGQHYLHYAYGITRKAAGDVVAMVFFGWAVGAPIVGWLSDHFRRRTAPIAIGSFMATICICILLYAPELSINMIYLLMFLYGFFCSVQVVVFAIGRENSPALLAGTAIAVTNMFVMFSGYFQPLTGYILNWSWAGDMVNGIPAYTRLDFQIAFSILPICTLIAAILPIFLKETHAQVKD